MQDNRTGKSENKKSPQHQFCSIKSGHLFSESPLLTSTQKTVIHLCFSLTCVNAEYCRTCWRSEWCAFCVRLSAELNECLLEVSFQRWENTHAACAIPDRGYIYEWIMEILHFTLISQQIWNYIWLKIKSSLLPGPWGSCLLSWQWNHMPAKLL